MIGLKIIHFSKRDPGHQRLIPNGGKSQTYLSFDESQLQKLGMTFPGTIERVSVFIDGRRNTLPINLLHQTELVVADPVP